MASKIFTLTIPEDDNKSNAVMIGRKRRGMIIFPAAWTAADIAILHEHGGAWVPVANAAGTRIDIGGAAADAALALGETLRDIPEGTRIRLWSHSAGVDEDQLGADRVLTLKLTS